MSKDRRAVALDILLTAEKSGRFANDVIAEALRANQFMSKKERAYIGRLAAGVTERRITLDHALDQVSKLKMKKCKPVIRWILRMGTYEILFMDRVPEEASCNEYVNLAGKRGFGALKGYVNGVLRTICRKKNEIRYPSRADGSVSYLSVTYSVPKELVELLLEDYDADTLERIFCAGEKTQMTTIRVNTDRISVDEFQNYLTRNHIKVEKGSYNSTSLRISGYDYIRKLPGYAEGYFAVQDESSCLPVLAAGIQPGAHVLDVCASPGGKTMYAASLAGTKGIVLARDLTQEKIERLKENLERMRILNVTTQTADATVSDASLAGTADVLIADLPCSGLGVMARKNDIKYHVNETTMQELAALQRKILDTSAAYVRPGGVLVYSTCTIDRKENKDNVDWFLNAHPEYRLDSMEPYLPEPLNERGASGFIQLLQGIDACDGFFIARFVRDGEVRDGERT